MDRLSRSVGENGKITSSELAAKTKMLPPAGSQTGGKRSGIWCGFCSFLNGKLWNILIRNSQKLFYILLQCRKQLFKRKDLQILRGFRRDGKEVMKEVK